MANKFDDNLGLFPAKKRTSENSPHYRGSVVLSAETLKALVNKFKAGEEPKLSAAGWVNDWEGGKRLSVKLQPWEDREQTNVAGRKEVDFDLGPTKKQATIDVDDIPF